jgi:hypothetical protein
MRHYKRGQVHIPPYMYLSPFLFPDPLLLRRINRDFFVVGEWDLTEFERLVLKVVAFAGE